MKKIKKLVAQIDEELDGAKRYGERYLELKADGSPYAGKFQAMANEELTHANILHEIAVDEIKKLKAVYPASMEMEEKWDAAHQGYIETAAEVKRMLSM